MSGWRSRWGLRKLLGARPIVESIGPPDEADIPAPIKTRVAQGERNGIWAGKVPVTGKRTLPPDPRMLKAIGLNHSFESAIADIVDNSIDAAASKVLVRIVRESEKLLGVCIVDNGRGMDEPTIDRAMTIGGDRTYDTTDLGHFGIGLKAASLGRAGILTVVSRTDRDPTVGRRWRIENVAKGFECDVLQDDFVVSLLDRDWQHVSPTPGTVVMWTEVKSFAAIADQKAIDCFVDSY